MKFTDYKYEHMDIEALQAQLKAICSKLQNAASLRFSRRAPKASPMA